MGIINNGLIVGDSVDSFRNGKNVIQTVSSVVEMPIASGYKITTSSNSQMTISSFHPVWATLLSKTLL